jgi:hypothetical protein
MSPGKVSQAFPDRSREHTPTSCINIARQGERMAKIERPFTSQNRHSEADWVSIEYEAGYGARILSNAEYLTATPCWRAGWKDADRDLARAALDDRLPSYDDVVVPWSRFGTGQQARSCLLPFDESATHRWKRSWVETDIAMSLAERRRSV